jgi:hypothetical protein
VIELEHFDPSENQNSRAPANYEAAHPKRDFLGRFASGEMDTDNYFQGATTLPKPSTKQTFMRTFSIHALLTDLLK